MKKSVQQTTEDHWAEVDATAVWLDQFFDYQFARVRVGSGDAWIDLKNLKARLENEGLESVSKAT
jgi:hypothetical protein